MLARPHRDTAVSAVLDAQKLETRRQSIGVSKFHTFLHGRDARVTVNRWLPPAAITKSSQSSVARDDEAHWSHAHVRADRNFRWLFHGLAVDLDRFSAAEQELAVHGLKHRGLRQLIVADMRG